MQPPVLVIDELSLTPPTVDDAADWADAQDDECAHWFDWPGRPSVEGCAEHLRRVTTDPDPDELTWAIRTPRGLAGGIELALHEKGWNVSYFVHPDHRRQGIARRALLTVVDWAFATRGMVSISTNVHVDNVASHKVLEAAGFTRLRTLPNPDADHDDYIYERRH